MAIKLVTFDLDNTLWDNDPVLQRAEQACYQYLQQQSPQLASVYSAADLAQLRLQLISQSPQLAAQVSKLRKLAMQQALQAVAHPAAQIPALVEQAFAVFYRERNRIELFPHARPLLDQLKPYYQLGTLTNGNSDLQLVGISEYFAFTLSAEKVGAAKPRPNLFHGALHRGNVLPHEMVHIGDHPEDDVYGAQQLGIHSIWFNPGKKRWSELSSKKAPTATVHCLSEIIDVLKRF